jgi:hypothetical protein
MLNRVNSVLIGKSVTGDGTVLYGTSHDFETGELAVLDKNKKLLVAGATIDTTDTIYIAETLADTYDVTGETGVSVTGINKLLISAPIVGAKVKSYKGRAYSAAVEQVVTITPTLTPVVATEYVLRIVYTDTREKPGQVTATYRHVATDATLATLLTAMVAKINAHTQRRVNATGGTTDIVLTGRAMPYDITDSVDSIDEYYQVNFKAFLTSANWGTATTPVVYTTKPFPGNGTWKLVRDKEKFAQSYKGITNRTHFPVIKPAMRTVSSTNYDCIVIEHDQPVQTPDNQYIKDTQCTTEIYIVDGAAQTATLLSKLDPWMASCPGAFAAITSL